MKKKRFLCALLCMMLLLGVTGCEKDNGSAPSETQTPDASTPADPVQTPDTAEPPVEETPVEEPPVEETPDDTELDLAAVYEAGMARLAEGEVEAPFLFPESNLEYLNNFYPGILDVELKQYYFAMAPVTNAPLEIAMVEAASEADAKAVREIFRERVEQRSADSSYPEETAVWKNNARVTSRGCYVFLAVLTDDYELPEEFILS